MKNTTSLRSEVLSLAWTIRRQNSGLTWSECQKAAWNSVRLRAALYTGVVGFSYTKENGEVRQAVGTLNTNLYRYESKGVGSPANPMVVKYYDVEAAGFRSCRVDRILRAA